MIVIGVGTTGARLSCCTAMADKRSRERIEKLQLLIETLKVEKADAEDDLNALRSSMRQLLDLPEATPDELAVGLALLAAIIAKPPGTYAPDVPRLAASARVDEPTVLAALDLFSEAGVLKPAAKT